MKVSVFGLGYAGCVSAACLASHGHEIWGVDVNAEKVTLLQDGVSPIIEPGVTERVRQAIALGRFRATTSAREALGHSEICLITVGTSGRRNGQLDPTHLLRVCEEIGDVFAELGATQTVVVRSTVLPALLAEARELLHRRARQKVRLCTNPEFLREGSAVEDFESPPFTVIGTDDPEAEAAVRELYAGVSAPVYVLSPPEASMVKYACNAYHALKVSFANEIGRMCHAQGIDARSVMDVFTADMASNISPRYLRPGFAFGGSCLPKDVRAVTMAARGLDLDLALFESILPSNRNLITSVVERVLSHGKRKIGLIGLSFKRDTDDLRESPFVELAERLLGKGMELKIYDPNVAVARLYGANRSYIDETIPHVSRLLVSDLAALAGHAEVAVVGHRYPGVEGLGRILQADCRVLDLCDVRELRALEGRYEGIAW